MKIGETSEQALIRTIREMQKHHLDVMTNDTYPSGLDGALNLMHHKICYKLLTELIDEYDSACEERSDSKLMA